ncbi:MAG: TldD/PmbA family protein [Acidimicrobiales bacterium]|jgi:TldD protein
MATVEFDAEFLALPLESVSGAALGRARELGCEHAEVRIERIRTQFVRLRDGRLETSADNVELGVGLRVVKDGSFGFAATVELGTDAAANLANDAVATARASAPAMSESVELADEPSHGEVEWVSAYELDPSKVPTEEKVALLEDWSGRLLRAPGVDHATTEVLSVVEDKHYADLSGTVTTQRRVRVYPVVEAVAVDSQAGGFETMRTLAPPAGRGWEYLLGDGWDFDHELARLPGYLAERLHAPSVVPGVYDLVIDPTNLWLTIHESIGHATELDRAMGYEAAYAGTSFATPDKLGKLAYGSKIMNVTGDRTVPHGLSTVGYDDEGVEAQSFDLIKDGVLVGYQLDRRIARHVGLRRSNGCAFADSPAHVPIQRMANVSLKPAPGEGPTTEELVSSVQDGFYVVGDKSWSIDMQRYNFQFTGQRFFKIDKGKIAGQVRDLAYQSRTTEFWSSMAAVGGESTYFLGGAMNCGKGQPGQVAPVSHGCPSALFQGVRVLNTRAESGR